MNPDIDAYIAGADRWSAEMADLREVLLGCGLSEELKWAKPCYLHDGRNLAIMQPMKPHLALMFFKGALLDDPSEVLREQGPNSRSARRIEFRSREDVGRLADAIAACVASAIAVEDAGLEVGPAPEPDLAEELIERIERDEAFRVAFESLTPGRRREYNLHISSAKKSETRAARVELHASKILAGKGLRDR